MRNDVMTDPNITCGIQMYIIQIFIYMYIIMVLNIIMAYIC